MDYYKLLESSRKLVNDTLEEVLGEAGREAKGLNEYLGDLAYITSDYTLRGGKRLRAFLVLVGYWSRSWGSGSLDRIRYVMAGVEFLQSYLLAHDDVMDRDTIRRGGPTVHVWFEDRCRKTGLIGDCAHYGISQAITAGDYLEALAVHSFTRSGLRGEFLDKLLWTYSRGLRLVAYGQFLDVLIAHKPLKQVREEDVYMIHKLKTASYTVELPLHLGLITSEYDGERLFKDLSSYAIPAGIAFQLKDDILGLYGDPELTGKPVGSDVREKKKTLLVVKAYNNASSDDRRFLEEIYDHKKPEDISDEDVYRVQEIVRNTGSLEYNVKKMEELRREAVEALNSSEELSSEARGVLEWLLELFIKREK